MFKILIAEDDADLRDLFKRMLIQNGYAVLGVTNGQEALDALDKEYFDFIGKERKACEYITNKSNTIFWENF